MSHTSYHLITLRFTLVGLAFFLLFTTTYGQVGINTDTPDGSAALDVTSTDKGVLIPRMSSAQRELIASPAVGLLVFDLDTESFWFRETGGWIELISGIASALSDEDEDTKVEVEALPDEDAIRFSLAGSEGLIIEKNNNGITQLNLPNNGSNVLLGNLAGQSTSGTNGRNIYIGNLTGFSNTTGATNVAVGNGAGRSNTTGNSNVYLGGSAGSGNMGSTNVMIGKQAGFSNENGNGNVFIGNLTGSNSDGSRNIFIGSDVGSNATGDNQLHIHNESTLNPLIYGEFDNRLLRINGSLNISNNYTFPRSAGADGQVLKNECLGRSDLAR